MKELIPEAPGSVIEHPAAGYRHEYQYIQESKVMTFTEKAEYLAFHVSNKRHPDGRIYLHYDDNGVLVANSVSPYAEIFEDNIEDKIKGLVMALKRKRYLTFSSCQGHELRARRFVGVAFCSEQSRREFTDKIIAANIWGVQVVLKDTIANIQSTVSDDGKMHGAVSKLGLEEREIVNTNSESAAFNILFRRTHDEYYFADLEILPERGWLNMLSTPIKSAKELYAKLYRWDEITAQVTSVIEGKDFPRYRY
jgi:hypothetical protein